VRRLFLASQTLEIRKGGKHAKPHNPRHATACEARFVAPVSPVGRRRRATCQPRHCFRSKKSPHGWASAGPLRTDSVSEATCPTRGFRTLSASRRPLSPRTSLTESDRDGLHGPTHEDVLLVLLRRPPRLHRPRPRLRSRPSTTSGRGRQQGDAEGGMVTFAVMASAARRRSR
jgi:hypothetical protein